MNEKPILFSGEMVKAILEGKKTVTRRVAKDIPPWASRATCHMGHAQIFNADNSGMNFRQCPYGRDGDRLWVRETCAIGINDDCDLVCDYMADGKRKWFDLTPENERYSATYINDGKRPSIFMPRWASRITLEITGVRVERLQDISEEDCCLEMGAPLKWEGEGPEPYKRDLRGRFAFLWDSINAKRGYSWASNPWVWVVEFKKVSAA